jgi:hypothetical protein
LYQSNHTLVRGRGWLGPGQEPDRLWLGQEPTGPQARALSAGFLVFFCLFFLLVPAPCGWLNSFRTRQSPGLGIHAGVGHLLLNIFFNSFLFFLKKIIFSPLL